MILLTLFFSLSLSPINISRFYIRSMRSVAHDNPTGIEREIYRGASDVTSSRNHSRSQDVVVCVCIYRLDTLDSMAICSLVYVLVSVGPDIAI